ncbi:MAG: hypothetical protein R2849_23820, partial [Thermomicrobiales bacterium]
MNPAVDRFVRTPVVRRSAWMIAILSIAALLFQGFAEQGGIGSALSPVPQQPLPFPRERIFGVDLSDRPSLESLEWLQASGSGEFALALIRVDADIVSALREQDTAPDAYRALDQLMAATLDTNVALCLDRPVTEIEDELLAELTIDALRDRYPDRIAYVTACDSDPDDNWESAIATQVRSDLPADPFRLLPLATGAVVELEDADSFKDLRTSRLRTFAGETYVLPVIPASMPLSGEDAQLAVEAIRNAAQIGLIMIEPERTLDPAALAQSISQIELPRDQLPEGFSGIGSSSLEFDDHWTLSTVGRIAYLRTNERASALQTTFSGTTIYLQTLLAPDAGSIAVWIDPNLADPGPPDEEIDLSATQAQDAAIPLAENLAAERHRIAVVTTGGEIAISGVFVSGQPASGWNAGVTSLALVAIATAALSIMGLARVQE